MVDSFFTYKNLGGDYLALANELRLGTPTAAFGVSDSHKYLLAALSERKTLYITADSISAERAFESIKTLSGKKCAYIAAKDEVVLYKEALSKDSLYRRITGIYEAKDADIIVADIEAVMQLFPAEIEKLSFERDKEIDYSSIPERLVKMGYTREYSIEAKGTFAVRGDTLDIFPVNLENPVRVDFFGDTVERIRPYDFVSGDRLKERDFLDVVAATDVSFNTDEIAGIESRINSELRKITDSNALRRAKAIADDLFLKLEAGLPFAGLSFVFPLLSSAKSIFSLLGDAQIIFDECKLIQDKMNGLYKEHLERIKDLKKGGEAFAFSEKQLLSPEEIKEKISHFRNFAVQTFASSTQFFQPVKIFDFHSAPAPSYVNSTAQLLTDIKHWLINNYRILIFTGSFKRYEKLSSYLSEEYVPVYPVPDTLEALHKVSISAEELAHGFILHEEKLVVLGSADLYTKLVTKRVRRRRGDMFVAPEIGDYAVHEKHGIGRITGTQKIETTDGIKEYVALEYKGGDTLYVPVEQMDILSKYMGEAAPALSKIGGAEFERVKERVKRSIRALAFDLKKLYAERREQHGFAFPENEEMMSEFEAAFTYEETPDQIASFEEIKGDMCSEKVMDRLLCGDVGYGKTEVAFRAAYLCILGGKQAALMCPGTVLSEQHFNTALERFKDFGVRVENLNRFKTPKAQAETLKRLKEGQVDFIIGTHRLLSGDVEFHDLGLLILDEEQRFGVEHKEKIKNVRRNIDCLTMTATPIPRTLHMSLAGIRDISTINTPPQKRLPVQTYVVEETETLIRDACIRELARGGQVFILYNRVESISRFAGKIAEIVPEGKVCYAHGRMDRDTLDSSVFSFYRGEKNILVTTTIIENGIDLPNANTIIVIDSDRLGISQLYQLRGRVGRSSRLAQAFFTFKPNKILTSDATERLKAIMQFTELGSGFKVAMRDLEIRGAGNVLGAEQHGHMDKIGYELYSKLLKEELTGENYEAAELDIKASAYIPETYIESNAGRMDSYKQIAEIKSVEDYKRVCKSLEENFGALPDPVFNLLIIALLKAYALKFNVKKIGVNTKESYLEFPSIDSFVDERLRKAIDKYKEYVKISMTKAPMLVFESGKNMTKTMSVMTKFLKFALSFT